MPRGYYPRRNNWTPAEVEELEYLVRQGYTYGEIAQQLGRTYEAVRGKRRQLRLVRERRWLLSASGVSRLMGVAMKTVAIWLQRRCLAGHKLNIGEERAMWRITLEALYDFVGDPRYFPLYDPHRIRDPHLRAHALEARQNGTRYLTVQEVGQRYYVSEATVRKWIELGVLPAVKWHGLYVPESALQGFVPPFDLPRSFRRWQLGEDQLLLRLARRGRPWSEIAAALGRSPRGALQRYRRLIGGCNGHQRRLGAHCMDVAARKPPRAPAPGMAG
jgi:hypothetical protein